MIENLRVGEPFGTSDHQIIRWNFVASSEHLNVVGEQEGYNYFAGDYNKICSDAKSINWMEIVKGDDIHLDYQRFKHALEDLKVKWVPRRKHKNGKCKWVTRAVTKSRRAKNKAWNKYQLEKTPLNFDRYKAKLKSLGIQLEEQKGTLKKI